MCMARQPLVLHRARRIFCVKLSIRGVLRLLIGGDRVLAWITFIDFRIVCVGPGRAAPPRATSRDPRLRWRRWSSSYVADTYARPTLVPWLPTRVTSDP